MSEPCVLAETDEASALVRYLVNISAPDRRPIYARKNDDS